MKKITSLEHAQQIMGTKIDFTMLPQSLAALGLPVKDTQALADQYGLWLITEAHNKLNVWVCDWSNRSQLKYSIWAPNVVANPDRPSGFGLAFYNAYRWRAFTIVGARLNVGSSEAARYIFEDFIEMWDSAWLIQDNSEAKEAAETDIADEDPDSYQE
jgi:hypothetical protein